VSKKEKSKKEKEEKEELLEQIIEPGNMQDLQEKWQMIELKTSILSMSKEILERNAALKWEQDKTRGLSVNHQEIIEVAKDILDFILE
tara:strand:- start:109 stop:372 length:264 start_codon:yes stop_codon:yes gene_type:complete